MDRKLLFSFSFLAQLSSNIILSGCFGWKAAVWTLCSQMTSKYVRKTSRPKNKSTHTHTHMWLNFRSFSIVPEHYVIWSRMCFYLLLIVLDRIKANKTKELIGRQYRTKLRSWKEEKKQNFFGTAKCFYFVFFSSSFAQCSFG